jgi:hypothetical protein
MGSGNAALYRVRPPEPTAQIRLGCVAHEVTPRLGGLERCERLSDGTSVQLARVSWHRCVFKRCELPSAAVTDRCALLDARDVGNPPHSTG